MNVTLRLENETLTVTVDGEATFGVACESVPELGSWLEELTVQLRHHPAAGQRLMSAGSLAGIAEAVQTVPEEESAWSPGAAWSRTGERIRPRSCDIQSAALMSLLERRRSGQPAGSIDACQLATLLTRSYRIQDLGESPDGYVRSWRPVPSAGGRHPFELLVAVRHVTDLAPGWWWFDPTSGELVSTTLDADHELYLSHASSTTANARPGAAVVCVAVWERTLARYPLGGSLVWRDAGALQAILQLVAADLAMSSRIVAGCGLIGDALPDGQVDVGAILLGSEPPRANQPE